MDIAPVVADRVVVVVVVEGVDDMGYCSQPNLEVEIELPYVADTAAVVVPYVRHPEYHTLQHALEEGGMILGHPLLLACILPQPDVNLVLRKEQH